MSYQYRKFAEPDIPSLHDAFLKAFSEYFVSFQPTAEQFRARILHKLNVNPDMSMVACQGGVVKGFVLHTINQYQGKATAYNGGTGVVPGHRRSGIATSLYERLLEEMTGDATLDRILLEVVAQNHAATSFYESIGFRFTRTFKCFKRKHAPFKPPLPHIEIKVSEGFKAGYLGHFSFLPSFLDSPAQIVFNLPNEVILEAHVDGQLTGHLIFNPELGRISQLAVHPDHRRVGIGGFLISHCGLLTKNPLTLMNIPEEEHDTIEALERMGFQNELNQFELELII